MKNKYQICAMISTVIFGLIAHGYMLTNKLCYHDDAASFFSFGGDYTSGRWALGVWRDIQLRLGIMQYSTPLWNGLLFILFIAAVSGILVKMFQIENYFIAGVIGATLICFPTVASIFAYMFTAPAYGISILLAVLCVYFSDKGKWQWILSAMLLTISMGIYQAYFGVATALFVLRLIVEQEELKKKWIGAFRDVGVLVLGLIGYFAGNKVCLRLKGLAMSEYQGLNQMGEMSFTNIMDSVGLSYEQFFVPLNGDYYGITNVLWIQILFKVLMGATAVLLIISVFKKKGKLEKLFQILLIIMIPLSVNIVFVMTGSEGTLVHTLMVVPYVFILVYSLLLCEKLQMPELVKKANVVLVMLMLIFFAKLDNTAYLKATHNQEVAISYYTNLIGAIKNVDGYHPFMPVLFYGVQVKEDVSIARLKEFDVITLKGYNTTEDEFIAYHANKDFLEIHCGFTYNEPADRNKYLMTEEFAAMPVYPEDGSVRCIDGVVVVRLAVWE